MAGQLQFFLRHTGRLIRVESRLCSNFLSLFPHKTPKHYSRKSYSVMRRERILGKDNSKSQRSVKVDKDKPVQLSILGQKILKLHEDSDSSIQTSYASKEAKELKSRMEALALEMDEAITENAEDNVENTVDAESIPHFYENEGLDDAVETVTFKEDVESYLTVKPSPLVGTEDPSIPSSNAPCVGCGALLQCQHNTFPGYLPSEYFKLLSENDLKTSICQRCYYIQNCNAFVEVSTAPEEYAELISKIRHTRSVVVMVVDVMDISGSIIPHLARYIGQKHPLVIVGNKADLLAPDCMDYLKNVRVELERACLDAGLKNIWNCTLISAKTGFGIEKLIDILWSFYKKKVDVFIVGTANAGKSSLFNTLLASDFCKSSARDLIQRATVSVWPGTTLNLLKFPVTRKNTRAVALRSKRLRQEKAIKKEEQRIRRQRERESIKTWELKEEVSVTDLRTEAQQENDESDKAWGQEVFGYQGLKDGTVRPMNYQKEPQFLQSENYERSQWTYDTPGIINPNQVMNLLTPEEAPYLTPKTMILPRCVVVRPQYTLFITGLARLDYVQGDKSVIVTVHCGPDLPLHVVPKVDSDKFYLDNVGTDTLKLPIGDADRIMKLPALVGREFTVKGDEDNVAAADIQLSSIGWVSIGLVKGEMATVRAYTPGRIGLHLRTPPLMADYRKFKGKRINGTAFFRFTPPGWVIAKDNSGKPVMC